MKDNKQDSILNEVRKNLKSAEEYWHDNYQRGVEDKEFVTVQGAQWEKGAVAKRRADGKPSLEFNLSRAYCRQQINTQRQNRPQAKVIPVDNGADVEIAGIIEGLIKDTEEGSDSESAYDTAVENAVYGGIGFFRIITDYVNEQSFNQEPRFMSVHNPHAIYIDPLSRALDGSDMNWAIVGEWVKKSDIQTQYGEDILDDVSFDEYSSWSNEVEGTVRIAEYFKKTQVKDQLWMLEDGTTGYKSKLLQEYNVSEDEAKALVVNERDTTRTEIKWYKVTGSKVLEETIFPGQYIPIIPVYGEVTFVEEERFIFSLVHFAKDPQRLFNYWKSTEAHILQKNQDDVLVVDAKGIAGFEDQWQNPGSYAAVMYNYKDTDQQPNGPPTRLGAAQPPVGILNAAESAKATITDILNMHAPMMGGQGNETSGVAIGMRQRQSETAHFHLQDNLNKSIRQGARILLGLYQALYTVPMVRRIIGTDGEAKMIKLLQENGEDAFTDITIGRYDIRMDTGPSFNTQREQNFALMMQLLGMNPQLFGLIGDILLQNSPLLNAKEIADRIRSTMPPQVLGEVEKIDPEKAKAQITQLDQLVQKLTADIEVLQKQNTDKEADRQLELIKLQLQSEKDIQVAQINASSRSDVQELRGVVELLKQQVKVDQVPQGWLQQGEGVDNYAPTEAFAFDEELNPQSEWLEPPSDMTTQGTKDPANEQGFLMSEETARENIALNPDQTEESALINTGGDLLPNMEQNNNV